MIQLLLALLGLVLLTLMLIIGAKKLIGTTIKGAMLDGPELKNNTELMEDRKAAEEDITQVFNKLKKELLESKPTKQSRRTIK